MFCSQSPLCVSLYKKSSVFFELYKNDIISLSLQWEIPLCTTSSQHREKYSLPRSRFLDVMQRSPKRTFTEALRDIQKTAARETKKSMVLSFNLFAVCFKQILLKLHTVKPYIMDTCLMWTPRYYGQFVLPLANESPYVFSNFNLLIRSLSMAPSVSILTGFDCLHRNFFSLFMCYCRFWWMLMWIRLRFHSKK